MLVLFSTTWLIPPFQDHTDNFGHPAIRELLHVFLYSRDNRLGNIRHEEFGRRVPNGMLSLAMTAVSILIAGPHLITTCYTGPLHSRWLQNIRQDEISHLQQNALSLQMEQISCTYPTVGGP